MVLTKWNNKVCCGFCSAEVNVILRACMSECVRKPYCAFFSWKDLSICEYMCGGGGNKVSWKGEISAVLFFLSSENWKHNLCILCACVCCVAVVW